MNAFPDDYIVHNLPLIVLSGLGEEQDDKNAGEKARTLLSEGGFRIRSDAPPVTGSTAQSLLQTLLSQGSGESPWHGQESRQLEQNATFRIQSTGRTFTLPPRKAPPPAHSPRLRPATDKGSPPPQLVLHSTISPLTPSSPLYPDGIMTPVWITKHQSRLPSIFMSFFVLVSDPNTSTLRDNKLKSEINHVRSVLTSTNYRTKLVVVLVGDGDLHASDVEERLNSIRKVTTLDSKSLYYLAAESSNAQIVEFSKNMLRSLYAGSIEYYRDLSKHARRKRSRNVVPQPTVQPTSGTSKILALAGWNVRYEFKLGVLAEFRQEMEAALRNYETAYEGLFGAEVFETIPSWSPRFNEARMLSDIIVIRIIRCMLWLGQTTNAVKWWSNHRNHIQSLIDRRGVGSETYGWEAWQSVWSRMMAELVQRAEVLLVSGKNLSETLPSTLYIDAEGTSSVVGQRFAPWENLHHEGYWLNIAQRHTQNRRTRASQMPDEDRASPGQSPASVIASKAHLYDKYLVLEPYQEYPLGDKEGYDYTHEIIQILDAAIEHFSEHTQVRMMEILQMKKASELMKAQLWEDASTILQSIWQSQAWRKAGWWKLLEQVGRGLLACAIEADNAELIAQLRWQLAHPAISRHPMEENEVAGEQVLRKQAKLQAALDTEHSLTRFTPTFAFATAEGHVGEMMNVQVCLQHIALDMASILQLSQVKVVFEGGLKPIYLLDDRDEIIDDDPDNIIITEVALEDVQSRAAKIRRSSLGAAAAVSADVNLALRPGQVKIFQLSVLPREAGDVSVAAITMTFESHGWEMTITASDADNDSGQWWELQRGKPVSRPCGRQRDASSARILPKPPKLELLIPELRKVYYTNETIDLTIHGENREDQAVSGNVEARLLSPGKNSAALRWKDEESSEAVVTADDATFIQSLQAKTIGEVDVSDRITYCISVTNTDEAIDHELEIIITYSLRSNPETKLTKLLTIDLPIVRPFEANFSFHSRRHEEAWPDFFSAQTISNGTEATGIKQHYLITAVVCSFAIEDLIVESASLKTVRIVGGAVGLIATGNVLQTANKEQSESNQSATIQPEQSKRFGFDLTLQKLMLGNREPVAVDVLLEIQWKRKGSNQLNTSILQVPRFLAPSTEPRVLLEVDKDPILTGLYCLVYTIENPSLHFLTFNLTMESSDNFAFSGTKSRSLSLVPISRHEVVYRIMPHKNKAWIRVHLDVIDAYFGQTLKIQPASDGIRIDKQGHVLMWVE